MFLTILRIAAALVRREVVLTHWFCPACIKLLQIAAGRRYSKEEVHKQVVYLIIIDQETSLIIQELLLC